VLSYLLFSSIKSSQLSAIEGGAWKTVVQGESLVLIILLLQVRLSPSCHCYRYINSINFIFIMFKN